MTHKKKFSWKNLVKDKGFYAALGICILAVGVVAAAALSGSLLDRMGEPAPSDPTAPTAPTAPVTLATRSAATTARQVQIPVTNVPDLRTTAATEIPTTAAAPTQPEKPRELYLLPMGNQVSKRFSNGEPAWSPTMGDWRVHNGTDFTGSEGDEVKAVADGIVCAVTESIMWGDIIEIDHGFGIRTRYCGVSARNLLVGDTVEAGDPIGVLGMVPCESEEGSHLHLELLSSDKHLDPVKVIGVEVRFTGQAAETEE